MRRQLLILGFAALAVLAWLGAACRSPVPAEPRYGWVAGNSADGYGTILHTTDYGETWVRQGNASTIPGAALNSVSAADDENVWAVGDNWADVGQSYGTILRTTDGGQTWTRQGGAASVPDVELSGVSAVSSRVAWAVGWEGVILKTTDRGQTWTRQAEGMFPLGQGMTVSAWDEDVAWVASQDSSTAGPALILHTTDGGATWTREGQDSLPAHTGLIDVHAASATVAWVVGMNYSCFRTTDAGQHWYRALPQAGLDHINGVCALDEQAAWLAADNAWAYFTPDAGDSWVKRRTPGGGAYCPNLGVTALNADTAWMTQTSVGPGLILGTFDRGATWTVRLRTDSAGLGNIGLRGITFAGAVR